MFVQEKSFCLVRFSISVRVGGFSKILFKTNGVFLNLFDHLLYIFETHEKTTKKQMSEIGIRFINFSFPSIRPW